MFVTPIRRAGLGGMVRVVQRRDGFGGFWGTLGKVVTAPVRATASVVTSIPRVASQVAVGTTKLAFAPFKFGVNVGSAVLGTTGRAAGNLLGSTIKLPINALKQTGAGFVAPFAPGSAGAAGAPMNAPSPELQAAAAGALQAAGGYVNPQTGQPMPPDGSTIDPATGMVVPPKSNLPFGLSMPALLGIGGGAAVLLYLVTRKGGGQSAAPKS